MLRSAEGTQRFLELKLVDVLNVKKGCPFAWYDDSEVRVMLRVLREGGAIRGDTDDVDSPTQHMFDPQKLHSQKARHRVAELYVTYVEKVKDLIRENVLSSPFRYG